MDAVSMLGGERSTPLDLTGLSPEEIRGVSAGRIGREQMMSQMVNLLAGQRGREATIAAQKASARLSEARTRKLDEPIEMTTITDHEGKSYQIPKEDIVQGMDFMRKVKRDKELNLLTQAQIKDMEVPLPVTIGKGEEAKTYKVDAGHYASIVEAGRKRKEVETRTVALKALEGVSLQDMSKPENYNNLLIANPGAATALLNRFISEDIGLSDAHYRHYSKLYADYSAHVLKMGGPDALVETINGLGRKLRHDHMLLNIPSPSLWGVVGRLGGMKTVAVPLPPSISIERIYKDAEELGVPVSEILSRIYERTQKE